MESSSSDEEFWNGVNKPIHLKPQPLPEAKPPSESKTLERVRLAAKEELNQEKALLQQKLRKEMKKEIDDFTQMYKEQIEKLTERQTEITSILREKDRTIRELIAYVAEQELLIVEYKNIGKTPKTIVREVEFQDKSLLYKYEAILEVCQTFKNQNKDYKERVLQLVKENKELKLELDLRVAAMTKQCEREKQELNIENERLKRKFEDFKVNVDKEIEVNHIIHKKQSDTILGLKGDLKQASLVLKSPRMYQKFRNKLSQNRRGSAEVIKKELKSQVFSKVSSRILSS